MLLDVMWFERAKPKYSSCHLSLFNVNNRNELGGFVGSQCFIYLFFFLFVLFCFLLLLLLLFVFLFFVVFLFVLNWVFI